MTDWSFDHHCRWCHEDAGVVWLHGHAQCLHCRTNIDPCCSGDFAQAGDGAFEDFNAVIGDSEMAFSAVIDKLDREAEDR